MTRSKILGVTIIILSIVILIAALGILPSRRPGALPTPEAAIGVINISGTIRSGGSGSDFFGGTTAGSDTIMNQIRRAKEEPEVKAVVLRINSGGGSAAGSQEITEELLSLKETGKPVVASMGDTAASGAYWIASVSDVIVANPGTMTGSIGVITQIQNWEELYQKIGIDHETFVSGDHKDLGSAARGITDAERELLQGMVDDIFDQFLEIVAYGRGMSREEVLPLADGRIFTGRQAQEAGLVDELGNLHYAVDKAADLAGIEKYELKYFVSVSPLQRLLQSLGVNLSGLDLSGAADLLKIEPPLLH